jgi:predicted nucleic acid-binding Zn finger protein
MESIKPMSDPSKTISKVWSFPSDSNPAINYETLQYVDGSASCNCKGWTRRVTADGKRSCKHTRYIDMGVADDQSTRCQSYQPLVRAVGRPAASDGFKAPNKDRKRLIQI